MHVLRILTAAVSLLPTLSFVALADDPAAIQKKLVGTYALTQPNGDDSDIVTAGSVLVIQQGPIVMAPTTKTDMCQNAYKNGRVSQNGICKASKTLTKLGGLPGMGGLNSNNLQTKSFVTGEKVWVTGIKVLSDGVVFDLFTDAYSDVRYKAALKFKFDKGGTPSTDEVEKTVAEVFKVQEPDSDKKDNAAQQQKQQPAEQATEATAKPVSQTAQNNAAPTQPAAPPVAPLTPPPPPPADPKTIALGQTPDEVSAALGQPEKIVKLGSKQIYIYKDMRVTFTGGKVSDVK